MGANELYVNNEPLSRRRKHTRSSELIHQEKGTCASSVERKKDEHSGVGKKKEEWKRNDYLGINSGARYSVSAAKRRHFFGQLICGLPLRLR